jgi:hypothetical protein
MSDIPTAPRYDRYGEIRYLGHVVDKGARKTWVVIRRKGRPHAFAVTEAEWLSLSATEPVPKLAPSIGVFGMSP